MGRKRYPDEKLDKHYKEKNIDYFIVLLLFMALFILTFIGVGDLRVVGLVGIMLCLAGMMQQSARVDIWGLIPLVIYNLMNMISSYNTYGNIATGFASIQLIFPVVYLLMACMSEKEKSMLQLLCACWAGTVAGVGICQFVFKALHHEAARLGGIVGNPNALGIFLVVGWFALLSAREDSGEEAGCSRTFMFCLEPVILTGLSLTLSMGSFCAMAAGVFVMVFHEIRRSGFGRGAMFACELLARAAMGFAVGLLMYISATRTVMPWMCVLLLLYICAFSVRWENFLCFLNSHKRMALMISAMGVAVACTAIAVRPSAVSTFMERLEMMQNGLGYIMNNPLLGIGPYQWRIMNLYDSDIYFNTWHIHNALIHVGVEIGLIAMAMLIWIVVRFYMKKEKQSQRAGFTALVFHNMMDTSFFYPSIVLLTMMSTVNPEERGKKVRSGALKVFFGICMLIFAWNIFYYMVKAGEQI